MAEKRRTFKQRARRWMATPRREWSYLKIAVGFLVRNSSPEKRRRIRGSFQLLQDALEGKKVNHAELIIAIHYAEKSLIEKKELDVARYKFLHRLQRANEKVSKRTLEKFKADMLAVIRRLDQIQAVHHKLEAGTLNLDASRNPKH